MRAADLRLYLVLDPDQSARSGGLIETALAAVRGGVTMIQLRAPRWKKREFVEAARALRSALMPFSVPLLIDDHADVALVAGADGLHIGQDDLSVEDARRLLGPDRIIGLSAGSPEELRSADPALVDYYGVGPVFATKSKADAGDAIGTDGLAKVVRLAAHPCVAIGGIGAANADQVAATGAAGIAVISAICGQPDPEASARMLLNRFNSGIRL
ncbi:thiamine phosphate synthase [Sutterella sp.]|uniref:thiamine phosphate synthase n=1 Tax=Sutterella sp. TaxID=1981025 RepID=UPI0026DF4186|nr:thiamine phosphate synthase [Sutterella sp.]MDO5532519.1 thiamine phosphate synthase [Sutterella sp.]